MEPYHRQPPADRADSKLKTAKTKGPHPPTTSIVPYPPQQSPREKKPVQPRHPPPASTQINRTVLTTTEPKRRKPVLPRHPPQASAQINCTGPTFHTAEPHTERKYDPARQRNLQRLTRPR